MKRLKIFLLASASLSLTGCFTVDTVTLGNGCEHVVMRNCGWKLLDWVPLFCGNADEKSSCATAFFRDDVTMEKVQRRFADYAGARTIECPVYHVKDSIFTSVLGLPITIPYLFTYREIALSGTLK